MKLPRTLLPYSSQATLFDLTNSFFVLNFVKDLKLYYIRFCDLKQKMNKAVFNSTDLPLC